MAEDDAFQAARVAAVEARRDERGVRAKSVASNWRAAAPTPWRSAGRPRRAQFFHVAPREDERRPAFGEALRDRPGDGRPRARG